MNKDDWRAVRILWAVFLAAVAMLAAAYVIELFLPAFTLGGLP